MMSALETVWELVDALNARDFERMARCLAEDVQITTFGGGEPTGKEAYLDIMRALVNAIPDLQGGLIDVKEVSEAVVTLTFTMSGTNTGDLIVAGMQISPATGRDVHLVLRQRKITVRNNQMASVESNLDPTLPTLLVQLGLDVPPQAEGPSGGGV